MDITQAQWLTLILSGLFIGMAKAGLKGLGLVIVVLMAQVFPAKASTGIVLSMLMVADLLAVWYYNRDADWRMVARLLPASVVGVFVGVWMGDHIDEATFRRVLAGIILFGVLLLVWMERRPPSPRVMRHPVIASLTGLAGGFATMVGNASGPVMSVYLLAVNLPKLVFLGTAAWFFLIINFVKLPFHIFVWHTITGHSLLLSSVALPGIALGFFIGFRIMRWLPERAFRYFVMVVTGLTALRMLLG